MQSKFDAFIESVKSTLIFFVAPLAFLAGYIYVLLNDKRKLENKLEEAKADGKLQEAKDAVKDADKRAHDSTESYDAVRAKYLAEHPDDKVQ